MSIPKPLLSVENLTVRFQTEDASFTAVEEVSFEVGRGETLVVLGESGSGKSVTANAIMDLLDRPPAEIASGSVLLAGDDLLKLSHRGRKRINGRRVAMVFQDPLAYLNPVYTVAEQVAEVFRAHGVVPPGGVRNEVITLLTQVGIPNAAERADQYPHQFSGGQRQRVMIAMALALNPEIIIADEPTTALDVTVQLQILNLLKELQAKHGMAIVLITHDLAVAAYMADRIIVMKDGRIVEEGSVKELLSRPKDLYTRQLLSAKPRAHEPYQAPGDEAPVLQVRNLSKRYKLSSGIWGGGTVTAVDDVSFDLPRGEVLGIVGESGSGKSTIMRTLMRLTQPTAGKATFHGRDVFAMNRGELGDFRRRVQVVFQDPFGSLNPKMTVLDIIGEPLQIAEGRRAADCRDEIGAMLDRVSLSADHIERYPHELSGGQCQRVAIARALISRPEIIVFDEAVSALDAIVQVQVVNLLSTLRKEFELSYIFITHDLHLIREFSDHLLVMQAGKAVEQGDTKQIYADPQHSYTRRLLSALPRPSLGAES